MDKILAAMVPLAGRQCRYWQSVPSEQRVVEFQSAHEFSLLRGAGFIGVWLGLPLFRVSLLWGVSRTGGRLRRSRNSRSSFLLRVFEVAGGWMGCLGSEADERRENW